MSEKLSHAKRPRWSNGDLVDPDPLKCPECGSTIDTVEICKAGGHDKRKVFKHDTLLEKTIYEWEYRPKHLYQCLNDKRTWCA